MNQKTRKALEELAAWLEMLADVVRSLHAMPKTATELEGKAAMLRELLRRN